MWEEGSQGVITEARTELSVTKSRAPTVYVPRRFRIGGIEGIPTGAAIVGTPQSDGMVAIDIESTPYVEPNPEVWSNWVAEAARRHAAEDDELLEEEKPPTKMVSEAALIEVGQCIQGHVRIDDPVEGAQLARWIQAGRADYVVEGPFPHEA